jgi:hypothetical protein
MLQRGMIAAATLPNCLLDLLIFRPAAVARSRAT